MGDPRVIVRKGIEAYNAKDIAAGVALFGAEAEVSMPGRALKGQDAVREFYEREFAAFPDARMTLLDEAVSGSTAFAELSWSGANTGPYHLPTGETLAPTGKKATLKFVTVATIENDHLTAFHAYWDSMDLLRQLGLIPAAAVATSLT
jgi:predicted ester cyclase